MSIYIFVLHGVVRQHSTQLGLNLIRSDAVVRHKNCVVWKYPFKVYLHNATAGGMLYLHMTRRIDPIFIREIHLYLSDCIILPH
jgi:hypothetical protein